MSVLRPIDALGGLRVALESPGEAGEAVFQARVMEPLRPFWESMTPPPAGAPEVAPALAAARAFSFYRPELDPQIGLSALRRLEAAGVWPACLRAAEQAWETLDPAAHGIELAQILFSFVLREPPRDPADETGGYTGFGGMPGYVMVMAWPTDYNLPRLPSATAHEIHHNVRFSYEPFTMQTTLGQYMVAEGLAEAFAAQLYGDEMLGPWAQALTEEQVEELKPRYRENLELQGFNEIRGYIFGDWAAQMTGYRAQGIPKSAGYTLGYRTARAFMQRSGKTAAAATYLPWQEIVAESKYFA